MAKRRHAQPGGGVPRPAAGGRTIEETIAAAGATAELLATRTREANQATGDLKAAMREHAELVRQTVREEIDQLVRTHANRALETMGEEVKTTTAMVEARILRRLDGLYQAWIGAEAEGSQTIADLMLARQTIRNGIAAAERDRATSGHPEPAGDGG